MPQPGKAVSYRTCGKELYNYEQHRKGEYGSIFYSCV